MRIENADLKPMSRLRIYADGNPSEVLFETTTPEEIAARLQPINVGFERWAADKPVESGDAPEVVMAAYRADIDRLVSTRGFKTMDVVSIAPDNPKREEMRAKFLDEHAHKEDEVRFFVDGSGQFVLHVEGHVYEIVCCKGDLISVPDGTPHWFDMGPEPRFVAIRFFTDPDGWVGHFTGTDIARQFPRYETPLE